MAIYGSAGSKKINPEIGDTLCGQLFIRKGEYIRDDLEVNGGRILWNDNLLGKI